MLSTCLRSPLPPGVINTGAALDHATGCLQLVYWTLIKKLNVKKVLVDEILILILHSAVQIYEFHIFIISSSSFPGILPTNLMSSSQLAC